MSNDSFTSDQRYFHVVVFGRKVPWTLNAFWKAIGADESTVTLSARADWGRVESREVRTALPYAPLPSDSQTRLKQDRDGNYLHDVFAVEVLRGEQRHVAVGVPYLGLGRLLGEQCRRAGLFARVEFVKADPQAVVEAAQEGAAAQVGTEVSKVHVRVYGQEIRGFSLSAPDVVLSPLYRQVMGHVRRVERSKLDARAEAVRRSVSISRCTVHQTNERDGAMSIQCDRHGNFKVWVQRGGRNLGMVRHWLAALRAMKADSLVGDYPMHRKQVDPDAEAE